jgi:hypothetical protein
VPGDGGVALLDQVGQDRGVDVLEGEELVGGEGIESGGVVPVAVAPEDRDGPCLEDRLGGIKIGRPAAREQHSVSAI